MPPESKPADRPRPATASPRRRERHRARTLRKPRIGETVGFEPLRGPNEDRAAPLVERNAFARRAPQRQEAQKLRLGRVRDVDDAETSFALLPARHHRQLPTPDGGETDPRRPPHRHAGLPPGQRRQNGPRNLRAHPDGPHAPDGVRRAWRGGGTRIGAIVEAVRQQAESTTHVVGLMEGVRDGVRQISEAGGEQARGSEVVLQSAVTMQDVAKQVRHTTEEQARGFGRIRESVEGVREAVETINRSLKEQTGACSKVASFLDQVSERTRSNEEGAQSMGESTRNLLAQAETLRESISKIRI